MSMDHYIQSARAELGHRHFTVRGAWPDVALTVTNGDPQPAQAALDAIAAGVETIAARERIAAVKEAVVHFADSLADQITGPVPASEKLAWTDKRHAAAAYLASTHTPEQEALLAGELDITGAIDGSDLTVLATKIVTRAGFYALAVAKIAGVRRSTMAAIDSLGPTPSQAQLDAVVNAAKASAEAAFAAVMAQAPS